MVWPAATIFPSFCTATEWAALLAPAGVITMPPVPKVGSRAPPDGRERSSRASRRGRNGCGRLNELREGRNHMISPPSRAQGDGLAAGPARSRRRVYELAH